MLKDSLALKKYIAAQLTGQEMPTEKDFKWFTWRSEVRTLSDVVQKNIELPVGPDVSRWEQRAEALEDWVQTSPSDSLAGILAPAITTNLEVEILSEDLRRWTLTAVAIQQFKQRNEKWPKDLAELESVGLNREDYSDTENSVFGYEVDGDKTFLWKRSSEPGNITFERGISDSRPLPSENYTNLSDFVLEVN